MDVEETPGARLVVLAAGGVVAGGVAGTVVCVVDGVGAGVSTAPEAADPVTDRPQAVTISAVATRSAARLESIMGVSLERRLQPTGSKHTRHAASRRIVLISDLEGWTWRG